MSWLRVLNENFHLQPESFVLAAYIFDKFLLTTKVITVCCNYEVVSLIRHLLSVRSFAMFGRGNNVFRNAY